MRGRSSKRPWPCCCLDSSSSRRQRRQPQASAARTPGPRQGRPPPTSSASTSSSSSSSSRRRSSSAQGGRTGARERARNRARHAKDCTCTHTNTGDDGNHSLRHSHHRTLAGAAPNNTTDTHARRNTVTHEHASARHQPPRSGRAQRPRSAATSTGTVVTPVTVRAVVVSAVVDGIAARWTDAARVRDERIDLVLLCRGRTAQWIVRTLASRYHVECAQ